MATVNQSSDVRTLLDFAKETENKKAAKIVQMMEKKNPILRYLPYVPANDGTSHLTTRNIALPTSSARMINQGFAKSKGRSVQIKVGTTMFGVISQVDARLIDNSGDPAGHRLNMERSYIAGMANDQSDYLFYASNAADPRLFNGICTELGSLSGPYADQIIDAGGTGSDNTSVIFTVLGEDTIHGIFPQGSQVGLKTEDMGKNLVKDDEGKEYAAWQTLYEWDNGIVVRDPRYLCRIANIDVSNLATFGTESDSSANLLRLFIEAYHRLEDLDAGVPVILCNRAVKQWLDIQAMEKKNAALGIMDVAGRPVTSFWQIPIERTDSLLTTEARVVA